MDDIKQIGDQHFGLGAALIDVVKRCQRAGNVIGQNRFQQVQRLGTSGSAQHVGNRFGR